MRLILEAKAFAADKHKDMFRPNRAKQPIVEHLEEVAMLVKGDGGSPEEIAAAWLHDVVEDTPVNLAIIHERFGAKVAEIVDGLTDPDHFEPLPLKERKALQAERLQAKSDQVKRVKLCDQISNVKSVLYDPPLDWSDEKSLHYVKGANEIAKVCFGLSPKLDQAFVELYRAATLKYNTEPS